MAESFQPPASTIGGENSHQPHMVLRDLHRQLLGSAHLYDDPQAFASGVHSALVAVTPIIAELVKRAGVDPVDVQPGGRPSRR